MRQIIKDDLAQAGAVSFFIGAMLATVIGLSVAWPVIDSAINSGSGAYATFTLSGNTSCGELVNITNGDGTLTSFEFNISGAGASASGCTAKKDWAATVELAYNVGNTSTISATNLTTAINNNATVSGTMTALNPSAGKVLLVYKTHGQAGNDAGVVLADKVTNGVWSGTTLSGGVSDASTMPSAAGTIVDQIPLFLVLVLVLVFIRAVV